MVIRTKEFLDVEIMYQFKGRNILLCEQFKLPFRVAVISNDGLQLEIQLEETERFKSVIKDINSKMPECELISVKIANEYVELEEEYKE